MYGVFATADASILDDAALNRSWCQILFDQLALTQCKGYACNHERVNSEPNERPTENATAPRPDALAFVGSGWGDSR